MTKYDLVMLAVAIIGVIATCLTIFIKSGNTISQTQKQIGGGKQSQHISIKGNNL